MSLTLDEIRQKKKEAEQAVKDILEKFSKETGITYFNAHAESDVTTRGSEVTGFKIEVAIHASV